ncbi:LLM class flavin-dependent oxidoreductase [Croceicoccus bisphenolivorans]|uniref:LLM class flavin-dependent oxidoreductase n=1 Tax=Croceicoccus bisphenolivorans TaxID=1783232 RepID=UPI000830EEBB|nr:LLM class flavin-dependent oxidoreductase [Croceicoccus bisphenolivorans]
MKFGVFYNPMVPKYPDRNDWMPGQEQQAFREMIEQIRFADSLGFDYAFLGEHHFTAEYAHNTATEVLLGALSQVTKNIRLGTGITHSSHGNPIRIAERIATADQLTEGRVEFGFGSGSPMEIAPFLGEQAELRRERAAAAGQIAADILGSPGVWPGVENEFFNFPAVDVIPKSFQKPHPPLWTSMSAPGQVRDAASRGLGALMLTIGGAEMVANEVKLYWETLQSGEVKPVGKGINPAVLSFASGLIAPTDELADERAREGLEFFGFGLTGGSTANIGAPDHHLYNAFLDFKAGKGDIREGKGFPPMFLAMGAQFADLPGQIMCGVDKAREMARQLEATNVDGLLINQKFGWTKHEHIMESLELWGTQIIPEFRERHAAHEEWRKKQLDKIDLPVVTSI